jgi:hypothetical protein
MDEIAVLVLNATYEPLHFTNARRAVTLLLAGKAEAVEASPRVIRSPSRAFALPAVIRLAVFIRKPFLDRVAFNKKNILRRVPAGGRPAGRTWWRPACAATSRKATGSWTSRGCDSCATRCIPNSCSPRTC